MYSSYVYMFVCVYDQADICIECKHTQAPIYSYVIHSMYAYTYWTKYVRDICLICMWNLLSNFHTIDGRGGGGGAGRGGKRRGSARGRGGEMDGAGRVGRGGEEKKKQNNNIPSFVSLFVLFFFLSFFPFSFILSYASSVSQHSITWSYI